MQEAPSATPEHWRASDVVVVKVVDVVLVEVEVGTVLKVVTLGLILITKTEAKSDGLSESKYPYVPS